MRYRVIKAWRTLAALVQAIVLLSLPFITINGHSALRFDVPTQRLYFLGTSLAMDEFFIVLLALLFLAFLFLTLTILFGRLWCGWACPQTVLSDLTGFIHRSRGARKLMMALPVLAMSALVGADIIWYFVPPSEFIFMLTASPFVRISWLVLTVIIFTDLMFIRRVFCATVCPYARLQSVLYDDRTMVIAYDPALSDECMGCAACARVCPVGIDIRDGLDIACINCAECIDACTRMRASRGKGSLVGYHYGEPEGTVSPAEMGTVSPGEGTVSPAEMGTVETGNAFQWPLISGPVKPLRINVLIMLLASLVFLGLFTDAVMSRTDFVASLRLDSQFTPRLAGGRVINAYRLSIKNRLESKASYAISSGGFMLRGHDDLKLPPGGAGSFIIYASFDTRGGLMPPDMITIEVMVQEGKDHAAGDAMRVVAAFPIPSGANDTGGDWSK